MNKIYTPLLFILVLLISSCANEENVVDSQDQNLFKSYKISRDAQGNYSINYNLVDGAYTETNKNITTNTNNIYAFEGDVSSLKTSNKSDSNLELEDNKIKVGLFENNEQRRSITVEDENIVMAKGASENSNYLQEYSVEHLGTDEYVLDFSVRKGVVVDFKYNELDNIYEVHLKEGVSDIKTYTKLYQKSSNLPLKIDFVNYIKVTNKSQSLNRNSSDFSSYIKKTKPRLGTQQIY